MQTFAVLGQHDVVDRFAGAALRRPETDDGLRREPLLGNDSLEHPLCVFEQRAGSFAQRGVVEDRRVATAQTPRMEERCPVEVRHQVADVDRVEAARSREAGSNDRCSVERVVAGVATGGLEVEPVALDFGPLVGLDDAGVLDVELGHEVDPLAGVVGQQLGDHTGRTRGVGDMHHGPIRVGRGDPQRRVDSARRGATDQQRHR